MPSLVGRARAIWDTLRQSPAQVPSWVPIPQDRVDEPGDLGPALQANKQYFEIRINEIFLSYLRQWFTTYDPMVLVVSEFSYAGQRTVSPFVVGPTMVEKFGIKVPNSKAPQGMVFADTRAAGPHPYRGGDIAVTVILYRTQREDYARKLLSLVESSATVLDFVVPVGTYAKMVGLVLDGVETLTGTDGPMDSLIGRRDEFKPVEPGYFVLTNAPESTLEDLWVRDKRLVRGASMKQATPVRDADYVLYSVVSSMERDESVLPFYRAWERVREEANKSSTNPIWKNTKANMAALMGMIDTSPDLTETHASRLIDEWIAKIKRRHDRAVALANMGEAQKPAAASDLDHIRAKAVSVLDM